MFTALSPYFAHSFGQRYELPIPLALFIIGGAGVVLLSFLFILPHHVAKAKTPKTVDQYRQLPLSWFWAILSFIVLGASIACGLYGSQTVAENILPTLFWLVVWIAIPLSCALIGDWTQRFNAFANIAKITNSDKLRLLVLGTNKALTWPAWLGWWPATILFFAITCAELIYNQTATLPAVTASALLLYFFVSGFMGLIYGAQWLKRGEVFSVLFSTWGRMGYLRFGSEGKQVFFGGLAAPFEASPSRIAFTFLLLVSVSFDGLLSTPLWNHFQHNLPWSVMNSAYQLLATGIFLLLAAAIVLLFIGFAAAVKRAGGYKMSTLVTLAHLLPSLLPISFGYLLAHNIEYLTVNSQLLFPLIGNPIGDARWPIRLAYPFNDEFEPLIHLLPSAFYWYFSVVIIVIVHIAAVVLAHRYLGSATKNVAQARQSEYPWIVAMVGYTILSLWLLAQPLVEEKHAEGTSYNAPSGQTIAFETASYRR